MALLPASHPSSAFVSQLGSHPSSPWAVAASNFLSPFASSGPGCWGLSGRWGSHAWVAHLVIRGNWEKGGWPPPSDVVGASARMCQPSEGFCQASSKGRWIFAPFISSSLSAAVKPPEGPEVRKEGARGQFISSLGTHGGWPSEN